jgi:type VI secretion system protein ImpI/type VI secretion system protein
MTGDAMRMQLSLLSWPDGTGPDARTLDKQTVIGRGEGSNWILPDPARGLSRRHCILAPLGDGWRLTDISANGTFINDASAPLGREQSCELHDGDRIRLGQYVIEAHYETPPSLAGRERVNDSFWGGGTAGAGPGGWPIDSAAAVPRFAGDPSFDPAAETGSDHAGFGHRIAESGSDFLGQPMPDHTPAVNGIWQQTAPARLDNPPADFDPAAFEDPDGFVPERQPAPPQAARPVASQPPEPPRAGAPDGAQPITPDSPAGSTGASVGDYDPAASPSGGAIEPGEARAPGSRAPGQAAGERSPASPGVPADAALLDAFLRGARLRNTGGAEPLALMEAAGAALRASVDGLREIQSARGAIKREFRILTTIGAARNGNPIKASASTDAALQGLLAGRRNADAAIAEVLDEIRLHEVAMVSAMRDAVARLLGELSPDNVRVAEGGLGGMLPLQRKARAFEQYEALYKRVAEAMEDDFDSVFGKAFARAYERVVLDKEDKPR